MRARSRCASVCPAGRARAPCAQVRRLGDWDAPYLTQDPAYEAAQLRVFGRLVAGGHVYRGRKPVHWSPSSATALAEAELEYPDGHTSRSVYVALPLVAAGEGVPAELRGPLRGAALAVWTTTAWTLPANAAVAVNERLRYALVEAEVRRPAPSACVASAPARKQNEGLSARRATRRRAGRRGCWSSPRRSSPRWRPSWARRCGRWAR